MSIIHGLLTYAGGGTAASFLLVAGGGAIVAFVVYQNVGPGSYDGPDEWGPLVYATMAVSALFVVGVGWQYL